jgi:hypothetical protein
LIEDLESRSRTISLILAFKMHPGVVSVQSVEMGESTWFDRSIFLMNEARAIQGLMNEARAIQGLGQETRAVNCLPASSSSLMYSKRNQDIRKDERGKECVKSMREPTFIENNVSQGRLVAVPFRRRSTIKLNTKTQSSGHNKSDEAKKITSIHRYQKWMRLNVKRTYCRCDGEMKVETKTIDKSTEVFLPDPRRMVEGDGMRVYVGGKALQWTYGDAGLMLEIISTLLS